MRPVTVAAKKLGIVVEALTAEIAKSAGIAPTVQGVAVRSVDGEGPAAEKLVPGDIITAVIFPLPGSAVRSVDDLQRVLSKLKDGDYIGLSVNRLSDAAGHHANYVVNLRVGN